MVTRNVILNICMAVARISAKPNGAPEEACESMTPKHGFSRPRDTVSPYLVKVDNTLVKAGGMVGITITSFEEKHNFKGFLLQARDSEEKLVGSFSSGEEGQDGWKFLECSGMENGSVTHNSRKDKTNVTFKWTAPSDAIGDVTIFATIVRNKTWYYVKQGSHQIKVISGPIAVVCPNNFEKMDGSVAIPRGGLTLPPGRMDLKSCSEFCEKERDCCTFEWSRADKKCHLHHYCKTKPEKYKDFITCRKKGYECEEGFELIPGNVRGRGFSNMDKTNSKKCGEACQGKSECCSYEFSPSYGECNLNKECRPSQKKFHDFIFCKKAGKN